MIFQMTTFSCIYFMIRRPPRSTRTATRLPYATRVRSGRHRTQAGGAGSHCAPWWRVRGWGDGAGDAAGLEPYPAPTRSEEHTSELQSLMRISYAVFCLKKKKQNT